MIENLNLEEKIDNILKKLNSLLENLSSNLSKEKTENALNDGYNYIVFLIYFFNIWKILIIFF